MTDEQMAWALFNAYAALELALDELPAPVDAQMQRDLAQVVFYAHLAQATLEPYMARYPLDPETAQETQPAA